MEQRQLIQHGLSSLSVSLPRKWLDDRKLKKGDSVLVKEEGNSLILTTEKTVGRGKISINVTSLDYGSIKHYIQGLYRFGYDEIEVLFDKPTTLRFKTGETHTISSLLHEKVNQFIGMEILEQSHNRILLKTIIKEADEDFTNILRRVFLLIKDTSETLVNGIKTNDPLIFEAVQEKHDLANKFANYALRLLNKYGYPDVKKTSIYYHIIAQLDRIVHAIKLAALFSKRYKKQFSKDSVHIFQEVHTCLVIYYDFFYNFDLNKVEAFNKKRYSLREQTWNLKNSLLQEYNIVVLYSQISEILIDIVDARMGLEY
ncbi:MAG: AbrB/MazE/SpoVT family DNA-binding domain-containing protein [Nanoarchaeota archaeon]